MRNISPEVLEQLNKLTQQRNELDVQRDKEIAAAQQSYGIGDEHYDYNYSRFTDNDQEFDETVAEIYAKYDRAYQIVQAKWAALFLIATNIARRGKPLRSNTAKRKLKKYGDDGKTIIGMIDKPVYSMILNSEPFLADELYQEYEVVLKNRYYAKAVREKIKKDLEKNPVLSVLIRELEKSKDIAERARKRFQKHLEKHPTLSALIRKFDREYEPF
ncbi:MAG: hypothetical protein J6W40_04140 [Alphaproteobacteria bacterium]|nr:hypothetical protein [Alphaproteobacteria bacterium]